MRVVINTVFLTSENFGGSWTYTYNLIRSLENFRDDVELIVLASSGMIPRFEGIESQIVAVDYGAKSRIMRVGWEQLVLPRFLKGFSPDILHSTGNVIPRGVGNPSVLTMHDFQYFYYPENFGWIKRQYLRYGVPHSVRKATRVICVSEQTKRHAMLLCGVPAEKLTVVYEAGLAEGYEPEPTDSDTLRNRYKINGPFIMYAGSSMPHKNLRRLIEAFARVAADVRHDLLIVGEPFGFDNGLDRVSASALGLERDRVRMTGFVPRKDLLGLYELADAYVFPSLFEGFGIPVLEAMGIGCPVVAARGTSVPEVAGDAAEYFDPMSVESIASAVKKVCVDEGLRTLLRERGFAQAKKFSWDRMAKETLGVYLDAINST